MKLARAQSLEQLRKQSRTGGPKTWIAVSAGTCGKARGADPVVAAFQAALKKHKLTRTVGLRVTGCHGFCEAEPNCIIQPSGVFYQKLTPADAEVIVRETLVGKRVVDRLLFTDPRTKKAYVHEEDIPFFRKQQRQILGASRFIDPTRIEDYIAQGGYRALAKALKQKPDKVLAEVRQSGLRGRGGAGFTTGEKWALCRAQAEPVKYIICNADEGDPGAYMDRSLLEGNPHSVIEGMIIGAHAIGATEGYIYVRNEYPLAVTNVERALAQARGRGLLGTRILGSKFNFDIKISRGAGAFVCGEETALMASIEGKRGEPHQRPPFPAVRGLWGKPTNINNVETWANVPLIVNRGATWYAGTGTAGSKGTKIFSLVGKVNNTGLVEVPMGMTLREIVFDVGGGIAKGKDFKAVQTGGPSGGCIPEKLLNLAIDYEGLSKAGSIMGSGGMIVMDQNTCMVDVARYFLDFLRDESCGKCFTCREGIARMYEIVNGFTEGKGTEDQIPLLEELARVVQDTTMCGLGQTAPNPVLSTLRYFRDEYIAHAHQRCPAGVCTALITYKIRAARCTGCMACLAVCPQAAITGQRKQVHHLDPKRCIKCGACKDICKFDAIVVE